MGKYGNGISFQKQCMYEKEAIKEALKGNVIVGEDENGFIYGPSTKENCERVILEAYDEVVFQAIAAFRNERILEKMIGRPNNISLNEYGRLEAEERKKDYEGEYVFESEKDTTNVAP